MRILLAAILGTAACSAAVSGNDAGVGDTVDLAPVVACTSTAGLPQTVPDGPPPVAGGTLIVLPDQTTAVASDPDDDLIWVADLGTGAAHSIGLAHHDEPGRLVVDAAGKVHVVLRRGGAIATVDPAGATLIRKDAVCPAPRGIAYDPATNQIHVACMGGELVSLPAAGGAPLRSLRLDDDLRDVLVVNGTIIVTRFRSTELLTLAADGTVASRSTPPPFMAADGLFTPSVAWRTVAVPSGGLVMLHQRGTTATLNVTTGPPGMPAPPPVDAGGPGGGSGYGSSGATNCGPGGAVVQSALFVVPGPFAQTSPGPFPDMALAVDVAVRGNGDYAVVSPARPTLGNVHLGNLSVPPTDPTCTPAGYGMRTVFGSAIAVAAVGGGPFLVQTRDPSTLQLIEVGTPDALRSISLGPPVTDAGHEVFHMNTGSNVACASCHPEGGDDGRVWSFDIGKRRTMSLRGGLRGTEPFHWNGDENDLATLMIDVFNGRMHGEPKSCDDVQALSNWMESIPSIPPSITDAAAVARGQVLFHDPDLGCASCHSGPHFTNNQNVGVGTGEILQVPRLTGLAFHAPYLHDGRAASLHDRFTAIGGGDLHGHTSQLSATQVDDLVAYLSSL